MVNFRLCSLQTNYKQPASEDGERVLTFPIGCNSGTSVSAKAILRRGPCEFSKDLHKDSRNSAPSSKASGGQTLISTCLRALTRCSYFISISLGIWFVVTGPSSCKNRSVTLSNLQNHSQPALVIGPESKIRFTSILLACPRESHTGRHLFDDCETAQGASSSVA